MDLVGHTPAVGGSKTLIDQLGQNDFVPGVGKQPAEFAVAFLFLGRLQFLGAILPPGGQPDCFFSERVGIFHSLCAVMRLHKKFIVKSFHLCQTQPHQPQMSSAKLRLKIKAAAGACHVRLSSSGVTPLNLLRRIFFFDIHLRLRYMVMNIISK